MADYAGRWTAVRVEVSEDIGWVIFNRPEKRNAMNPTLNREMRDVLETLELDDSAKIVVLTGEGIGFVCWSPLAMAFLTGAIDHNTQFEQGDFRGMVPWFTPENRPGNLAIVKLVEEWARRKEATAAQIALAWLSAQEPWMVPIPGTTKMPHLLDNIGADAVRFVPDDVRELNAALLQTPVQGARCQQWCCHSPASKRPRSSDDYSLICSCDLEDGWQCSSDGSCPLGYRRRPDRIEIFRTDETHSCIVGHALRDDLSSVWFFRGTATAGKSPEARGEKGTDRLFISN
jgi:Aldo/keto reductase family/Enoyl-CoA hydratase/isomerase